MQTNPSSPTGAPIDERRGFLAGLASVIIGGLISLFPVVSGLLVFFDPIRRKSNGGNWIRVASLDSVPADGVPRFFPVVVDRRDDAWTTFVNEPVGAVYLVREPGQDKVSCFSATCPHAGCFIAYLADKKYFQCPCHTSAFNCRGERMLEISAVPPRDMDTLEVKLQSAPGGRQEVRVKFQEFITGTEEKHAKS